MSLEADLLVDRLRLKRRLTLWRVLAILAFVLALLAVVGLRARGHGGLLAQPHLVRLTVDGIITDDATRVDLLDAARKDANVRGLILAIDSPGGSVAGGEALHDAVARFAAVKPVVVVMGGTAASAGYMIAVPAARIFASNATLTGSIGVLLQSPDVSGLLDKVGVNVDELVSGPLKGQPSIVKPLSADGRAMLQGVVADLFDQFVTMVAAGRHMDPARVRQLADGRPYTGRQALPLGLIDQIGTEQDARNWLAHARAIPAGMPVRPLRRQDDQSWLHLHMTRTKSQLLVAALGLLLGDDVAKNLVPQGLALDGAVSVWQP